MVAVKLVMDMSASLLQKRIILFENTHRVDVKAVPHSLFICTRDFVNISGKFLSFFAPLLALNRSSNGIFLLAVKAGKSCLLNGHEHWPELKSWVSVFQEHCVQVSSRNKTCPQQRTCTHSSCQAPRQSPAQWNTLTILAWKCQLPNIPDWTQYCLLKRIPDTRAVQSTLCKTPPSP